MPKKTSLLNGIEPQGKPCTHLRSKLRGVGPLGSANARTHPLNSRFKQNKNGFSLFEISIVILVLSFLALGAMQGGELVRKSKLTSAQILTKSSIVGKMDGLILWLETTMPKSFNAATADGEKVNIWYDTSNTKITPFNATQNTDVN